MTYILITIVLFIAILGIWISGGGQKANDSIPKKLEGPPFRIYEAVVKGSPLKLMHFISESNEINLSSSLVMGDKEIIKLIADELKIDLTQSQKNSWSKMAD